jgi:hypothetical protein
MRWWYPFGVTVGAFSGAPAAGLQQPVVWAAAKRSAEPRLVAPILGISHNKSTFDIKAEPSY